MSIFKGFAKKINVKTGTGKRGPWKLYSVKLENDDGTEVESWISLGFDAPDFKEGDYVKITTEKSERGYENATEVKRLKNAPARSAGPTKSGGAVSGGSTDARQSHIHYQSSRKDAIEILKLLTQQDALPLSSAKTKAGEAKRYEEIMALVDKITVQFFHDAETLRKLESVVDAGADEKVVGKLPEDSDDDEGDDEEEADDEGGDDESDDE